MYINILLIASYMSFTPYIKITNFYTDRSIAHVIELAS